MSPNRDYSSTQYKTHNYNTIYNAIQYTPPNTENFDNTKIVDDFGPIHLYFGSIFPILSQSWARIHLGQNESVTCF